VRAACCFLENAKIKRKADASSPHAAFNFVFVSISENPRVASMEEKQIQAECGDD
jgi:hypothetical protein